MKYKIKNSDLFINNKLHPEGSEVELSKDQAKGIEDFLIPLTQTEHPDQNEVSQKKIKSKGNKK